MFDSLKRNIDRERRWLAEDIDRLQEERKEAAVVVWTMLGTAFLAMFGLMLYVGVCRG